jgi:adenylate cyclase
VTTTGTTGDGPATAAAAAAAAAERTIRERNEQKLAILLEVSKGLTRVVDIGALLDKIAGFCLQIFDVDYVSVLLADERGDQVPKVARDRQGTAPQRSVPQSIVRTVVQDKVAVLSDNAPEDLRFGGESILVQRVRSTMCAPLVGSGGRVLGVLYVDNVTSTHRVDEEDLEFLVAFAGIAAVAIEHGQFSERIRHESLVRSNFERYFAPNLAAQIADSPGAVRLGGEKRPVAVLFSDIRGFTALSEAMNPDDMASLLTEYFTEMVECVFRHGGTLDKFMGDAVMAQWGAPIGSADDADRAVRAAVDMMSALDALNAKWRRAGRPELGIGIGLSYGDAFAGNIGSERRLEFTVIGDTVNTASRLCASAEAGEVLLTEDIRRALHDPPPLEVRPALELKGKAHPVPVYRVQR